MIKTISKIILTLLLFHPVLNAKDLSFKQAWELVLKNSDELKAKNEDVNIALLKQGMAKDLYMPNISLSATYTHLNSPIEASLGNAVLADNESFNLIAQGIAKGAANAAYTEAIKNGKTPAEAQAIAQKVGQKMGSSFQRIGSKIQNSSIELAKQDLFDVSVRAIWPLFTGGKRRGAKIIAKALEKESKAMYEMAKQGQFEDLANVYFSFCLAREVAKTKSDVQKALKKHHEHAKLLFKNGQIAKIDLLNAKARLDKASVESKKAKRNEHIAKLALKSLLHIKEPFRIKSSLFTNEDLPALQTFKDKTLQDYPGLKALRAKQTQTEGLIKTKKANYYPKVFLFGNYNIYKDESLLRKNSPKWLVGVGLNYDLIDSKGRGEDLDIAYSQRLKVNYLHEDTKRKLSLLVEQTYKSAKLALEEYEGLKSSVELAQESVRLRQKLYYQGMGTSLDVVDAQMFLQGVKIQRLVASYKYILSLSKLLALSDQIDDFFTYQWRENEK